jgi:hypothetical protein
MLLQGLLQSSQDEEDLKIEWGDNIRNFGPKTGRKIALNN